MRKFGLVAAAAAAALVVTGCGSEDQPEPEQASMEDSGGEGKETKPQDLSAGLLTAKDLPEGSQVQPFDAGEINSGISGLGEMLQDVAYDPAECQANTDDPLSAEGIDAAGVTASVGSGEQVEVVVNAVYTEANADDLTGLSDYVDQCGTVSIKGTINGEPIDVTVHSELTDPPEVEADAVVAMETSSASEQIPGGEAPTRIIYMVDGNVGVYVAGNPDAAGFNIDELARTALERARSL